MVKKILVALWLFAFAGGVLNANDGIKIYIIHGYNAKVDSFWYPWLKSALSSEIGTKIKAENIEIPKLPAPNLQMWKDKIKEVAGQIDEKTYFVTHGIGGVATLKFIEESGHKVGGVVLVGGFDKPLGTADGAQIANAIRTFTSANLDYVTLTKSIKHIVVLATRDDKIVPYKLSEDLADKLNAKFILEHGGRFKANQVGYSSPQLIYSEIRLMIDTDNPLPPPPKEDKKKK